MKRSLDKDGNPQDWCSYIGDRILKINYSEACRVHDFDYADPLIYTRWEADARFFKDNLARGRAAMRQSALENAYGRLFLQTVLSPVIASAMWLGVRAFGWKFYGKKSV